MTFPKTLQTNTSLAVEGDFAGANPRASVLASEGALVAGSNGTFVGRFAWATAGGLVNNTGSGLPTGFVKREMNAVITLWLGEASMIVPAGLPVTLFNEGDFYVRATNATTIGQKAFADLSTGQVISAAAGATIAAFTGTAAISGTVMTVSAVGSGTLSVGELVTGANIVTPTRILSLGTGTGGTGTYNMDVSQTAASGAVTGGAAVETNFRIASAVLAGELVKISTWGKQ